MKQQTTFQNIVLYMNYFMSSTKNYFDIDGTDSLFLLILSLILSSIFSLFVSLFTIFLYKMLYTVSA